MLDAWPESRAVSGRCKRGTRHVRKMTHTGYVILFVIGSWRVDVLRIVHDSRDWLELIEG